MLVDTVDNPTDRLSPVSLLNSKQISCRSSPADRLSSVLLLDAKKLACRSSPTGRLCAFLLLNSKQFSLSELMRRGQELSVCCQAGCGRPVGRMWDVINVEV